MSISRLMQMAAAGQVGGEYQISRSLRFNSADSAYLSRTPASAGDRKTWTWSGWVKRSALGGTQQLFQVETVSGNTYTDIKFSSDKLFLDSYGPTGDLQARCVTDGVFRDVSAWYHVVAVLNTANATAADRAILYVNGVRVSQSITDGFDLDAELMINTTNEHRIGADVLGNEGYLNGYLTEVNFIDGQALTPSSFGETNATTGVWSPIQFNGPWNVGTGVNGFYLNFSDNSDVTAATLGADYSGNGNNWTPSGSPGFSVTAGAGNDSLVDTPTQYGTDTGAGGEVRGNYCTFNPLFKLGGTAALTWASNGNLQAKSDSAQSMIVFGTMGLSPSTKFYNEFTMTNVVENDDHVGIVTDIQAAADTGTCVAYKANGDKIVNGVASAYGATYTDGDVIGIAVNLVDNEVTFYKNGASQGTITGVTSGTYFHRVRFNNVPGEQAEAIGNWGQRPFAYTAPSGFKALVTTNLPQPTVVQGDKYFDTKLWAGNSSTQSIALEFAPGWIWNKSTGDTAGHAWWDVLRGTGALISSQSTDAETTGYNAITSFGSNAISLGADNTGSLNGRTNETGRNYVGWVWKANGAGVSNTAGTITGTVTVSANTIAGISIVTYTGNGVAGATVGHGLGAVPRMIIVKNRDQADAWQVYQAANTANPETDYLVLNTTAATADALDRWNDTAPTLSVFSLGDGVEVNTNTEDYVAYCFAEVEGFSKFGSYTGNDVMTAHSCTRGLGQRFLMIKNSSATQPWVIIDNPIRIQCSRQISYIQMRLMQNRHLLMAIV
jgi:hypothetical protein